MKYFHIHLVLVLSIPFIYIETSNATFTNHTLIIELEEIIFENILQFGETFLPEFLQYYDQHCYILMPFGVTRPIRVNPNKLKFQLHNSCRSQSFDIVDADQILNDPNFNVNNPVIIFSDGYLANASTSTAASNITKAYSCRGDVNILILDSDIFISTLYSWSALNTKDIGFYVATAVEKMARVIPIENFHLIGHSLGAQIMGYAGIYFKELTGKFLPRITGLDPARPCFYNNDELIGIGPNAAEFVDIIHTNPGLLGQEAPLGNADFYANGLHPIQPGCFGLNVCSHWRSWKYYAESVYPGREYDFIGTYCNSYTDLENDNCNSEIQAVMGYATPSNTNGIFYVETNDDDPYGQNAQSNETFSSTQCGLCVDN